MDEVSPSPASPEAPERVGEVLRAARERQGLSLAEVAARTRVPLRHLEAIEVGDYVGLPSLTYATGFARAYARTVGVDEVDIARNVRAELAGIVRPKREYQPYDVSDPSRVPSRGVAMVAMGLALAVLILAGLWFASGLFRGGTAPASPEVAVTDPAAAMPVVAPPPTPPGGQVLVTATDEVWVRIYDADGKTLHQGTLKAGERFDVPADATDPMINVGRPDKISVTVNGSQLQGLNFGDQPIKDVRVSAAALQARAAGQPLPPAPAPSPTPTTAPRTTEPTAAAPEPRAQRPRQSAPRLTETQRANLAAARAARAGVPPPLPPQ
jgi:transcriptional regulator with XRE-family HTH domain